MTAKKVRVEFLDGAGQGAGGITVKATGCAELQTAPTGQAFFLVEDENFAIFANGSEVYKGSLSSLPEKIVFKQDGGSWKAAWSAHTTASPDTPQLLGGVPCGLRAAFL